MINFQERQGRQQTETEPNDNNIIFEENPLVGLDDDFINNVFDTTTTEEPTEMTTIIGDARAFPTTTINSISTTTTQA